jgi:hypothetical protein
MGLELIVSRVGQVMPQLMFRKRIMIGFLAALLIPPISVPFATSATPRINGKIAKGVKHSA